jgi:predicted RNA binding protein YcfA (HicA-like mRNA interferase family)
MPRCPGVNHLDAVRALQKAGFRILRQGKHIVMGDGTRKVVIPRHNPVNAITMGGIIVDAGLTMDEFRKLL